MIGPDEARGKNRDKAAQYGHMFIQTEKTEYFPGDTITGNIYLNLYQNISSNQIFLRLKGKECFHIYEKEHIIANHTILCPEKAAYAGPSLQKGQFVFPFTFLIPKNVPGTFFQQGHKFLANIMYYLEAIIRPNAYDEPRIKYKHRFVVVQVKEEDIEYNHTEVRTAIPSCCFSRGYNILRVRPEKSFYLPGDIAQVFIELDNSQCSLNNKKIIVVLTQKLTLRTKSKVYDFYFKKIERELEGVRARKIRQNQLTAMNLAPLQEGNYWDIKYNGNIREYLSNLSSEDLTQSINSTTNGTIITSEYFIEVKCEMDSKWTVHPTATDVLEIRYPPSKDLIISWPPDWNPQIMNNVNFGMSLYDSNKARSSDVPSRDSNFPNERKSVQLGGNQMMDDSSIPLTSENGSGVVSESNGE